MSQTPAKKQSDIDRENAAFWSELCGSGAARALGVTGNDRESLYHFDRWFFSFYPYLDRYIPFEKLRGRDVLEVGLGYGSVAQRLAAVSNFTGLDIAHGPVAAVMHRLRQSGLAGSAVQGSILAAPFQDASFDLIVSIGCFHHTGNIQRAVAETARLLRPGGEATIMVYNAASYYRWICDPMGTAGHLLSNFRGKRESLVLAHEAERKRHDANKKGDAAPETVMLSSGHLHRLLQQHFVDVRVRTENAISVAPFHRVPRAVWLRTMGRLAGVDLYSRARKPV